MKFSCTVFILGLFSISILGQCNSELEKYVLGFDSLKAESFSFLNNSLDDVKIVGYGEDTHGTSEFTTLAEELMKYLSSNHGFNLFILETGFGEGQYLNDFAQGRRDDLMYILENHNSTWRYHTEEFCHLMNWLRSYNDTHSEKINVLGCEMQYVISDVNRIKDYLVKVGSDYNIEGFEKHLWQDFNENEKSDYFISYLKLKNYFQDNYELFTSKTSEEEFQMAYQHVWVLGQFVLTIHQHVEQRKHDLRDMYMGENIQWIMNYYGHKSRALYWAHNAHVGDWVSNGIVDVTGHQLRKMFGESYFNIATDFGTGSFKAFSKDGKLKTFSHNTVIDGTLTKCLKDMGNPNAFFSLRRAKKDKLLLDFIHSEQTTMSGAGAQVRNHNTETNQIVKAFDAIIYLDHTNEISWAK